MRHGERFHVWLTLTPALPWPSSRLGPVLPPSSRCSSPCPAAGSTQLCSLSDSPPRPCSPACVACYQLLLYLHSLIKNLSGKHLGLGCVFSPLPFALWDLGPSVDPPPSFAPCSQDWFPELSLPLASLLEVWIPPRPSPLDVTTALAASVPMVTLPSLPGLSSLCIPFAGAP